MLTEGELDAIVDKHTSPDYEYGEHKDVNAYAVAQEVANIYQAEIDRLNQIIASLQPKD
jgi:hypothetical protein